MKNLIFLLFTIFSSLTSLAQQKGASPIIVHNSSLVTSNTYAVVVGISDYQDKDIPDLRFADKDAEAFANFLRSDAGGKLDGDHLKVLINSQATMAQFANALDWLWEVCKEGDQAIIYFSGHGDVEKKSMTQPGFLLCWDAPARVYLAGGALALPMFQDIISTLSVQNKAKVLVITDACHSGKLSGSSINGAQATAGNLAKQYANEIKILSCQPNEYSIEGEQWGGGRGAFSYHLIDALYGMADNNNDQAVTLQEIGRYLEDHVTSEVAPVSQVPMVIGNRNERLSSVDTKLLASIRSGKTNQMAMLTSIESKGIETEVLANVDTSIQKLYHLFKKSLNDKKLLELSPLSGQTLDLCADVYYEKLINEPKLEKLHSTMRRNYAAALQDEAQQAINSLLGDDPYEQNHWLHNPGKYLYYPKYLEKAIELLGDQHYMYKSLMAKKLFFEAKNMGAIYANWETGAVFNDSIEQLQRSLLTKAIKLLPDAAYLQYAMGNTWVYHIEGSEPDSFFHYQNQAIALSPNWIMPRLDIANFYMLNVIYTNWTICEKYLLQGLELRPNSYILTERLAWVYQRMNRTDDAVALSHKMVLMRPDLPNGFATLASTYEAHRQYDLAESFAQKALSVDSTVWDWPAEVLLYIYITKRQYEKAFKIGQEFINKGKTDFKVAIYFSPEIISEVMNIEREKEYRDHFLNQKTLLINFEFWHKADSFFRKHQWLEAKTYYITAFIGHVKIDTTPYGRFILGFSKLAQIFAHEQQSDSAEYYFKKSINYYPDVFGFWNGISNNAEALYHYSRFLCDQSRFGEAKLLLLKAEDMDPRNPLNYYGMAIWYAHQNQQKEALEMLTKALKWYYFNYDEIMSEPLLKNLRNTQRFKTLMKQYFPDGSDMPKVEALFKKYYPEFFK